LPRGAGDTALNELFLCCCGVPSGEGCLSSDVLFIDEYGPRFLTLPLGVVAGESESLFFAARFGDAALEYAWKGFLKAFFSGTCVFAEFCLLGRGLALRLALGKGWNVSGRTSTKFEGNRPTMRLSRLKRPIHHEPSPALRHSMRSPSINPRSRFVCDCHDISTSSEPDFVLVNPYLSTPRIYGLDPAGKSHRKSLVPHNDCVVYSLARLWASRTGPMITSICRYCIVGKR
jgi:hypothetical protein